MPVSGYDTIDAGSGTKYLEPNCRSHAGFFQCSFLTGASGTVSVYGRINSNHDYKLLATFTSDDLVEISLVPDIKVTYVTSGGQISVGIWESL